MVVNNMVIEDLSKDAGNARTEKARNYQKANKVKIRRVEYEDNKNFEVSAIVMGKIEEKGHLEDYLLKNEHKNIVTVHPQGKHAILDFTRLQYKKDMSLVKIQLKTGRSHQIRVQFSHHGYPLFGDQKYSKQAKPGQQVALFSHAITFQHPTTKEILHFSLPLPCRYPWNEFKSHTE